MPRHSHQPDGHGHGQAAAAAHSQRHTGRQGRQVSETGHELLEGAAALGLESGPGGHIDARTALLEREERASAAGTLTGGDDGGGPDPRATPTTRGRRSSTLAVAAVAAGAVLAAPVKRWNRSPLRQSSVAEYCFDILYVLPLQALFRCRVDSVNYAVLFATVFNSWLGEAFYNTRFDTDDQVSRLATIAAMVGVVGLSYGIGPAALSGPSNTFAVSYVWIRVLLVLKYARAWAAIRETRWLTGLFMAGFSLSALLWSLAAWAVPAHGGTARAVLGSLGTAVDYATPFCLLPWMVGVHPTHMPERFASITVLASAGNLFALAQAPAPPPVGAEAHWAARPALTWGLGAAVMVLHLLLYSRHLGLHTAGFERSTAVKATAYAHLYLHMPLAGCIEGASIQIATAVCDEDGCLVQPAALHRLCACLGGALVCMGLLHATCSHGSLLRLATRCCGAAVLWALPAAAGDSLELLGVLAVTAASAFLQVLLDYAPAWLEPSKRLGRPADTDGLGGAPADVAAVAATAATASAGSELHEAAGASG